MVAWQGSEVTQLKKNREVTQAPVRADETKWEGLFLVSEWVAVLLMFTHSTSTKVLLNKDPRLIQTEVTSFTWPHFIGSTHNTPWKSVWAQRSALMGWSMWCWFCWRTSHNNNTNLWGRPPITATSQLNGGGQSLGCLCPPVYWASSVLLYTGPPLSSCILGLLCLYPPVYWASSILLYTGPPLSSCILGLLCPPVYWASSASVHWAKAKGHKLVIRYQTLTVNRPWGYDK